MRGMGKHFDKYRIEAKRRHNDMRKLRSKGWTFQAIADQYGMTRQAVHQVCMTLDKRKGHA